MTVITVLRESEDSILIAADSGGHESPGPTRIRIPDKLKRHPLVPVAWAGAGGDSIGERFTGWLQDEGLENWNNCRSDAGNKFAELIGDVVQRISISQRRPARPDELAQALLVGWLDSQPQIIELDDRGVDTSYLVEGFHAIGAGKLYAYTAHRTLQRYRLRPLSRLNRIMRIAATMAVQSDLPIHIWRVTSEGIQEVQ